MRNRILLGGAAFTIAAIACSSSSSDSSDNGSNDTPDASVQDASNPGEANSTSDTSTEKDSGPLPAPTPPMGAALQGLTLFDGWTDPHALAAPVNSAGWEDCSYISAAGERLYFGYTQYDYYLASTTGTIVIDGALRPGEIRPGFEIYEATINDGGWNVTPSTVNLDDASISEAAEGVDDSETTMAFIRYDAPTNSGDIYLSKKSGGAWGTAQKLSSPINTSCVEDNAALSRDGTELYFDSNRADALGATCKAASDASTRTIYVSKFDGANWGIPVAIPGAPNTGAVHWQIYPREDPTLYWGGTDNGCGADICILRASLEADGGYGDASVVIQPTPAATANVGDVTDVGEVSITRDGHWMYFVYIQKTTSADGGPNANLSIGVAHHP